MTTSEELKLLFKRHRWAAEELAHDQKMQEVNLLCSTHPRHLYAYLYEKFGSNAAVLGAMRSLVLLQGARRKTLRKD